MSKQLIEASKYLSLILRHQPDSIGVTLDSQGWIDITILIAAARRAGKSIDRFLIDSVVATSSKKRFTISHDGLRIRAAQGHSAENVAISYVEKVPPEFLYHGTASRFLKSICQDGVKPGLRHHVHLTHDEQTALLVGKRHGDPVVLTINSLLMYRQGFKFFQAENGIWLTANIPKHFFEINNGRVDDTRLSDRPLP